MKECGLSGLYKQKNLIRSLYALYPEIEWDRKLFSIKNKKSNQRLLFELIKELFPNEVVFENYMHEDLKWSNSRQRMQLDIWIPTLKLALEYQGRII